ncbi:MAG: cohesin domain-containing protein [Nitrospirota bacterium]
MALLTVPSAGHVGDEVTVNVVVTGVERLYSAPFYLSYNPSVLELTKVTQGEFLKQDGQQTAFLHANHAEMGRVMIGLSRLGQVDGITGAGVLVSITFLAKAPGIGTFAVHEADFRNTAMEAIATQVASTAIRVAD